MLNTLLWYGHVEFPNFIFISLRETLTSSLEVVDIMNSAEYPFPAGIYLLKVNNTNTRARCEIHSNLTMKTPERLQ